MSDVICRVPHMGQTPAVWAAAATIAVALALVGACLLLRRRQERLEGMRRKATTDCDALYAKELAADRWARYAKLAALVVAFMSLAVFVIAQTALVEANRAAIADAFVVQAGIAVPNGSVPAGPVWPGSGYASLRPASSAQSMGVAEDGRLVPVESLGYVVGDGGVIVTYVNERPQKAL